MHLSSYKKMEYLTAFYEKFFPKSEGIIKVLDIGSCDKGGTYRPIFESSRYNYTGLDIHKGPNVDFVPGDIYQWKEIADETFDVVITGQTFEYIEYPWLTIKEIERILKPSGFCILIVPSSVHYGAPGDGYRYYADGLTALAKWAGMRVQHVSVGGIPETEEVTDWISEWNDACLVAQKNPAQTIDISPFVKEVSVPVQSVAAYNRLRERVNSACGRFADKKPFVLFGAGWIGDMVLEILGSDNVSFYVDNSSIKIGTERKGKTVVSYQDYAKNSDRYNCLITASEEASLKIMQKLHSDNIACQILYGE